MNIVIEAKHNEECLQKQAEGVYEPYFFLTSENGARAEYRDSLGRRNGSGYRFMRLVCNHPKCPASILAPIGVFEEMATAAATAKLEAKTR